MKIEHLAIWTQDLEKVKDFYIKYFNMKCGDKYENIKKHFSSYFLSFRGASTRIELMHIPEISNVLINRSNFLGLAHIAISVGSKESVNELTEKFRVDGYKIVGEPRTTGDGYYESIVEDCEGNLVEITE